MEVDEFEIDEQDLEAFLNQEDGVGGLSVEELLLLQEDINTYRSSDHMGLADQYLEEILGRQDMGQLKQRIQGIQSNSALFSLSLAFNCI